MIPAGATRPVPGPEHQGTKWSPCRRIDRRGRQVTSTSPGFAAPARIGTRTTAKVLVAGERDRLVHRPHVHADGRRRRVGRDLDLQRPRVGRGERTRVAVLACWLTTCVTCDVPGDEMPSNRTRGIGSGVAWRRARPSGASDPRGPGASKRTVRGRRVIKGAPLRGLGVAASPRDAGSGTT